MKGIAKETVIMFITIVGSNLLIQVGEEEKSYLTNPIKFFSISLLLSIVGGYISYKIFQKMSKEEKAEEN